MFKYLLDGKKKSLKEVTYEIFGEESPNGLRDGFIKTNGGLKSKFPLAYLDLYEKKSQNEKESQNHRILTEFEQGTTPKNLVGSKRRKDTSSIWPSKIYAYRKILLLFIWPPKLLEAVFGYLRWGLERLSLFTFEGDTEASDDKVLNDIDIILPMFSPRVWLVRLPIYLTFGLIHGFFKYLASPYNQIIKPIVQAYHDAHSSQKWSDGFKFLAMLGLGIFVTLLIAATVFSGGGALPMWLAVLQPLANFLAPIIMPYIGVVASWFGGGIVAFTVIQTLVVAAALIISQKICAWRSAIKDIISAFEGYGGYDETVERSREFKPKGEADPDFNQPNGIYANTWGFVHEKFNAIIDPQEEIFTTTDSSTYEKNFAKPPRQFTREEQTPGVHINPYDGLSQFSTDEGTFDPVSEGVVGSQTSTTSFYPNLSSSLDQTGTPEEGVPELERTRVSAGSQATIARFYPDLTSQNRTSVSEEGAEEVSTIRPISAALIAKYALDSSQNSTSKEGANKAKTRVSGISQTSSATVASVPAQSGGKSKTRSMLPGWESPFVDGPDGHSTLGIRNKVFDPEGMVDGSTPLGSPSGQTNSNPNTPIANPAGSLKRQPSASTASSSPANSTTSSGPSSVRSTLFNNPVHNNSAPSSASSRTSVTHTASIVASASASASAKDPEASRPTFSGLLSALKRPFGWFRGQSEDVATRPISSESVFSSSSEEEDDLESHDEDRQHMPSFLKSKKSN